MVGIGMTYPVRRSLDISNRLNETGKGYIDLKKLYETSRVRQDRAEFTGVFIGVNTDEDDDATVVNLRCNLWDDDDDHVVNIVLFTGYPYMIRLKRVYQHGTTAGAQIVVVGQ